MAYNIKDLIDKVAVVTGGTSGIGYGIALRFAQAGATVCIVGRNRERADKAVDALTEKSLKAYAHIADVSREEEVKSLFDSVIARCGRIDILCNCAGISPAGTVESTAFEDFQNTMKVDLYSVFLCCKYAIPHFRKSGGGNIINIAGTYGMRPVKNKAAYACAKAGALSLTQSVAIDFADQNIRCNAICPGFVDTPLNQGFEGERRDAFLHKYQPMDTLINADDIANAALFLASDMSRTVTGQSIVVDGGSEACLYNLNKQG
jgi:NAD(P)-dependent dehydrogenase (short-subunit alcohol dehydrogenase family)